MPIEIRMPALSPTMESGTLAKWLVKEGDEVESGTILAEIETDKATMEYESIDDGIMGKILVAEGTEDVSVGDLIAVLLEDGEDASAADSVEAAPAAAPAPAAEEPAPAPVAATPAAAPAPAPAAPAAPTPAPAAAPAASGTRVFSSPLARRIAADKGFDISQIPGTGPRGRVVKKDVENFVPAAAAPAASSGVVLPGADMSVDAPYEEIKLSNMRKTIAKRLTESKQTVPHFYLTVDVQIDQLMAARKELNAMSDEYKISVNDFIIRACALALKKVPDANVQFQGDKLLKFSRADISMAVAIDGGLITPVIRGAEHKGLRQISDEAKDLALRARDGKLMPEDYQGGTFSISNLGMFGIKQFDAVINPPQAAILAVGTGEKRPVIDANGNVSSALVMTATLSCDHRAIDGAVGAKFLDAVKTFLEKPSTMLL